MSVDAPANVSDRAETMSVVFGGVPVPQAVEHVDMNLGPVGAVVGVDESVSFEPLLGVGVLAAVAAGYAGHRRFSRSPFRARQSVASGFTIAR